MITYESSQDFHTTMARISCITLSGSDDMRARRQELLRTRQAEDQAYFEEHLETIESNVHDSPNWVKYAMNNALINIGVRNPRLEKKAIAAAKRIGRIEVDYGRTGCKTPDAVPYIKKTVAHNKKKKARKAR